MNLMLSYQSETVIQLSVFESIMGLLSIDAMFLPGILVIGAALAILFRKDRNIPKVKTSVFSLLLYYYLYLSFTHIVGIPTLRELLRLSGLGEPLFNPNLNLTPFAYGLSLSFILNIFLFIPLGFLCPVLSRTFEHAGKTVLMGLGLSLFIEISQLFTLYRATDVDDLLTNVLGTVIGYLCFKLLAQLRLVKSYSNQQSKGKDTLAYWPVFITAVAFVFGFLH